MNSSQFMNTLILGIVFLFNSYSSNAQCDTVMIAPDSLQWITNGKISSMARRGDTLYFGGDFNCVGRYYGTFVAVDSSNGDVAVDQPTWPKSDGDIYTCISDGIGGWIIGGNFTRVGDSMRRNVAYIDSSGKVTALKVDLNKVVNALFLKDNKLYIGGEFDTANNQLRRSLAVADLSTNTLTPLSLNINDKIHTIFVDDTTVYFGGEFTSIGMSSRSAIAAIDTSGTLLSFNPVVVNNRFSAVVKSIYVDNSRVLLGGMFATVNNVTRYHFAAVDKTSGATVTGFNAKIKYNSSTYATSSYIKSIKISNNRIFIAGRFGHQDSSNSSYFLAIDSATGNYGWGSSTTTTYGKISDMYIAPNGKIYLSSLDGASLSYRDANGVFHSIKSIIKIDTATRTLDTAFDIRIKTYKSSKSYHYSGGMHVYCIGGYKDKIVIGGDFNTLNVIPKTSIAAVNLNTNTLHDFNIELHHTCAGSGINGTVSKLIIDSNRLYVLGVFCAVNNTTRYYLACIDVDNNNALTGFNLNSTIPERKQSMVLFGDDLYISHSNPSYNNISKVNKYSGAITTSWNPMPTNYLMDGYNSGIDRRLDLADSSIYITSTFRRHNSYLRGIIRYNLATNTATFMGNIGSWPQRIDNVLPYKGKLYTCGIFNYILTGKYKENYRAYELSNNAVSTWYPPSPISKNIELTFDDPMYKGMMIVGFKKPSGQPTIGFMDTALTPNITTLWRPDLRDIGHTVFVDSNTIYIGDNEVNGKDLTGGLTRFDMVQPQLPVASITHRSPICAGTTHVTYTMHSGFTANTTYQWYKNGVKVSNQTSDTYTFYPVNGDIITCKAKVPSTTSCYFDAYVTVSDTVEVTPNATPTIGVAPNADSVCAGTRVYYSANTNMPNASYQWKVGSTNYGTNSDTFSYIPSNGDVISCVATKDTSTCFSPSTATDDTTMMVKPNQTASISISDVSSGNVCVGSTDTFNASTNVTGASFQWQVNAINQGSNDSTFTYQPANNDNVRCIITMPTTGCYTQTKDTSNVIVLTQQQNIVPTISISTPSNTVCAGDVSSFSSTTNITGGTYIWRNNSVVVGSNSNLYSYTASNNDIITCTIIVPKGCYNPDSAISNSVSMVVTPKTTPSISISGPPSVGIFTPVNLIANINNAGNNYSISWTNNGSQFATTTNNSTSYIKQSGTDNITATIKPSGCYDTAISNTLIIMEAVSVETVEGIGDNIEVYPNPFSDIINIKGLSIDDQVKVYDVTGRTVLQWNAKEQKEEYSYDLGALSSGMYIIEIKDMQNNLKKSIKVQKYK